MSCGGRTCDLELYFCNEELKCACKPGRDPAFSCDDMGQDCSGCKNGRCENDRCVECADGWTRTNGYCQFYSQECPCPDGQYCWNWTKCHYCPTGWTNDESHIFCVPKQSYNSKGAVSKTACVAGLVGGSLLVGLAIALALALSKARKAAANYASRDELASLHSIE